MRHHTIKLFFSDNDGDKAQAAEREAVARFKVTSIQAGTIYHTTGVWEGETEHGFVFETITDNPVFVLRQTRSVARELAREFGQQSVLVTSQVGPDTFELVEPGPISRLVTHSPGCDGDHSWSALCGSHECELGPECNAGDCKL